MNDVDANADANVSLQPNKGICIYVGIYIVHPTFNRYILGPWEGLNECHKLGAAREVSHATTHANQFHSLAKRDLNWIKIPP